MEISPGGLSSVLEDKSEEDKCRLLSKADWTVTWKLLGVHHE